MYALRQFSEREIGQCWSAYRELQFPAVLFQSLRRALPHSETRSLVAALSQPEPQLQVIDRLISGMDILAPEEQQELSQSLSFMVKLRSWAVISGADCDLIRLLGEYRALTGQTKN